MSNIYSQFLVTYIVVIKWLFMVEKFHGVATSCLLKKLCGLLTSVEFSINVWSCKFIGRDLQPSCDSVYTYSHLSGIRITHYWQAKLKRNEYEFKGLL